MTVTVRMLIAAERRKTWSGSSNNAEVAAAQQTGSDTEADNNSFLASPGNRVHSNYGSPGHSHSNHTSTGHSHSNHSSPGNNSYSPHREDVRNFNGRHDDTDVYPMTNSNSRGDSEQYSGGAHFHQDFDNSANSNLYSGQFYSSTSYSNRPNFKI